MSVRVTVNPIACEAHGLCAELVPEVIVLDDWGYPVIARGELAIELERHARRAVSACPTLALRLEPTESLDAPGPADAGRATARPGRAGR